MGGWPPGFGDSCRTVTVPLPGAGAGAGTGVATGGAPTVAGPRGRGKGAGSRGGFPAFRTGTGATTIGCTDAASWATHRGLRVDGPALTRHAGRGDHLDHSAARHGVNHHARAHHRRRAEHHRGRRAHRAGHDHAGLGTRRGRDEDAVRTDGPRVADVHDADLHQRDVHRRRRRHEDPRHGPPEAGDEDHRVTAVLVVRLGVHPARRRRTRPVPARPDPLAVPPGPVTTNPDHVVVRARRRRVPQHRGRRPGDGHRRGLLHRRLDGDRLPARILRRSGLRLVCDRRRLRLVRDRRGRRLVHDRRRRRRRLAIDDGRRWLAHLADHAARGEHRASHEEHPAHRRFRPSFACWRDAPEHSAIHRATGARADD